MGREVVNLSFSFVYPDYRDYRDYHYTLWVCTQDLPKDRPRHRYDV